MLQSIINTLNNISTIINNEKTLKSKISVLNAYAKISLNLLLGKRAKKETIFNYKIRFFDYKVFFWLFYEIFIRKEYWFKARTKTPCIIDCGSNIGMSILFFKKLYPNAKIIGFEPDKETFQLLEYNIRNNKLGDVIIHNTALSNKEGIISFYKDADIKGNLAMSITKQVEEHNIKNIKETKVKSVKLSDYINKEIDFLKLDVEGAETYVIKELSKSKKLKYIKETLIEYHYSSKNPKNKLRKILKILEKNNFKICFNAEQYPPFFKHRNKAYNLLIYAYQ